MEIFICGQPAGSSSHLIEKTTDGCLMIGAVSPHDRRSRGFQ
jgi:hypothetical protein